MSAGCFPIFCVVWRILRDRDQQLTRLIYQLMLVIRRCFYLPRQPGVLFPEVTADVFCTLRIGLPESGIGGLACGAILAKEGYQVCVLEKNKQIGGTLQTFVRDRIIFDSGVHYVGGLDKGQNLYQLFKFLGIMDRMKLRKMDEDVFDAVLFGDDPRVYRYAQGYPNFISTLVKDFPEDEAAIRKYCDAIKDVCSKFPLYNLRSGDYFEKVGVLEIDTQTFLESITSNKKLQNVLAGNREVLSI